jgi:hypothetical protein
MSRERKVDGCRHDFRDNNPAKHRWYALYRAFRYSRYIDRLSGRTTEVDIVVCVVRMMKG